MRACRFSGRRRGLDVTYRTPGERAQPTSTFRVTWWARIWVRVRRALGSITLGECRRENDPHWNRRHRTSGSGPW